MNTIARIFESAVNGTLPGALVSARVNKSGGYTMQPATEPDQLTGEDVRRDVWLLYDTPYVTEVEIERLGLFAEAHSTTAVIARQDSQRMRIACNGPQGSEVYSVVHYPRGRQTSNTVRADAILRVASHRGILERTGSSSKAGQ